MKLKEIIEALVLGAIITGMSTGLLVLWNLKLDGVF